MKNIDSKQIIDTVKKGVAILKNPAELERLSEKNIQNIVTAIILILLLDVLLILWPQFNRITKVYLPQKKEIAKQLNEVKRGSVKTPEIQHKLGQIETDVQSSLDKLMDEKDIPEFLSWVSVLARDNKIKVMEIKPLQYSEAKIMPSYYLLPIQLRLETGYHQLGKFINELEEGRYFVKLVELTIKSTSKSNITHDADIRLETFFSKNIK